MDPLEKFLGQARYIHGPGVPEESYYGALEALLNTVGETLDPEVQCVMQLKDTGAGVPDGGFFTAIARRIAAILNLRPELDPTTVGSSRTSMAGAQIESVCDDGGLRHGCCTLWWNGQRGGSRCVS